jgi:hypothetical protein
VDTVGDACEEPSVTCDLPGWSIFIDGAVTFTADKNFDRVVTGDWASYYYYDEYPSASFVQITCQEYGPEGCGYVEGQMGAMNTTPPTNTFEYTSVSLAEWAVCKSDLDNALIGSN